MLDELFPRKTDEEERSWTENVEWSDEWEIEMDEIREVVKRRKKGDTAPDPDGVKARIWEGVPDELLEMLRIGFGTCLKEGSFPDLWKVARLVLIPKGEQEGGGEVKARPICLINEIGKVFERIIVKRLNNWMEGNLGSALEENQCGFRRGRSTMDC